MTIDEQIEVMTHFQNGGEVEYFCDILQRWRDCSVPLWNWDGYEYRKKEKPKPKLRPWKPEEVPFPCAIKLRDHTAWYMITDANSKIVYFGDRVQETYDSLLKNYEQHNGKPCGVEE